MVERPIYKPASTSPCVFEIAHVDFKWHSGFAPSQKKKNVLELHKAAREHGLLNVLEVSSKSDLEVGRRLSSFNLHLETSYGKCSLESIYQGSKVFENGGPFFDIYKMPPLDAKRDHRVKNSGQIIGFQFENETFSNFPLNAFYDWIYLKALCSHVEFISRNLSQFDGFSDVEFNPKVSINTQARAISIFMTLMHRNYIEVVCDNYSEFEKLLDLHEEKCDQTLI